MAFGFYVEPRVRWTVELVDQSHVRSEIDITSLINFIRSSVTIVKDLPANAVEDLTEADKGFRERLVQMAE